jgi:hypothetical protein
VPETPVEKEGRASGDAKRDGACRIGYAVLRDVDLVLEVSARHKERVASVRLAHVGEVVADLEREAGARVRLNLVVDAHAVLMPGYGPVLSGGVFARGDVEMGVVEVDVPAEDAPYLGEDRREIEEVDHGIAFLHDVRFREEFAGHGWGALSGIDPVRDGEETLEKIRRDGVFHDKVAVGLERRTLFGGETVGEAGGMHSGGHHSRGPIDEQGAAGKETGSGAAQWRIVSLGSVYTN